MEAFQEGKVLQNGTLDSFLIFDDLFIRVSRWQTVDLKETLMKGSIVERKSFMRTFIKEIRVNYPRLEVEYTIPLPIPKLVVSEQVESNYKETPSTEEVLCIYQIGRDNAVKSAA